MRETVTPERDWFKSSYSGSEGDSCVEVAFRPGAVLVRDSKEGPDGALLTVKTGIWTRFVGFAATAT
ncbi:DUF397 domain-containing protein [Streptomyces chilikensis]|uniref:DUF397 domain-containing protein n=1 Tax=Streptomyces chilikensis TaxID=1194079 RepID=A0ABV3ELZ1_9ACTN